MERKTSRDWRYLDSEADRRALIEDIRRVRLAVVTLARAVPPDQQALPRYHGWSLGAMLAHLHLSDSLALLQIKVALIGVHPAFSLKLLNRFNGTTTRWFQKRVVATTIRQIESGEARIADFILRLPMDGFSRPLYYTAGETELTAERAVQAYFLHHWQEHLTTMQKVEGMFYEPPNMGRV
ncbi:MAG: hypothetical protein SGI73_17565 [Chloroflexota bacterium]|nr:hypothetical protein [Chloroflexota bacterium]